MRIELNEEEILEDNSMGDEDNYLNELKAQQDAVEDEEEARKSKEEALSMELIR